MKSLLTLALLCLPLSAAVADEGMRSLDSFINEFKNDPVAAKEKYKGKKFTFQIEVQKRVTDSNKVYHQAVIADPPKNSHVVFKLPKSYRATDKLVVSGTLKHSTWEKDEKWMFFEPCDVEKEIQVLPALYDSTTLLQKYLASQKKVAEDMVGKPIDIKGVVRFMRSNHAILEYVPSTDAKGKVLKDKKGFELLGRALVTVKFTDGSPSKVDMKKGMEIEARGVVEEMKAGAILIKDAQLMNK